MNMQRLVMPALALALAACGQDEPEARAAPQRPPVSVVALVAADGYLQNSSYTGRVEAVLDSAVGFELGGKLRSVDVDEGDRVRAGEVLARLDSERLRARRAEAAAAREQVAAELELARTTLARTEEARGYKGVSQQQLDEAGQRLRALQASWKAAGAQLDSIDVDIGKASLAAPFDGIVIERLADPGQVLAAGQPLLRVQSHSPPEVRIGVSAEIARSLETGVSYPLVVTGREYRALLTTVIPRRDEATRTVDALFALDAADGSVRPGDLARFQAGAWIEEQGYWIPVAALTEGPRGLWQALVAEPTEGSDDVHKLAPRLVEVLYTDADHAYVRGTLAAGEWLVRDGVHRVVAGQSVTVASVENGIRLSDARPEKGQ